MKIDQIRNGMKVYDRWWPVDCRGKVIKVLKHKVHIRWLSGKLQVYDVPHCQFLEVLAPAPQFEEQMD